MAEPVRIEREGEVQFQIGDSPPFGVDVITFHNDWYAIDTEFRKGTGAEIPHYKALVRKYGGPENVTASEAIAVIKAVEKAVEDLEKKADPSPSSATNTDSTPST